MFHRHILTFFYLTFKHIKTLDIKVSLSAVVCFKLTLVTDHPCGNSTPLLNIIQIPNLYNIFGINHLGGGAV